MTSSEHVLSQGGGLSGDELGRLLARARERQTLTRTDLEDCVRSTAITPELVEDLRRLLALDGIALDASVDEPTISFLREIEAQVDVAEALAYENEHEAGPAAVPSSSASSVLDPWCKAHQLDNLYVVDTSFFVTSAAVNPTLTTVANAMRVGDHLTERLGATAKRLT